jgi:hypothetical protein
MNTAKSRDGGSINLAVTGRVSCVLTHLFAMLGKLLEAVLAPARWMAEGIKIPVDRHCLIPVDPAAADGKVIVRRVPISLELYALCGGIQL